MNVTRSVLVLSVPAVRHNRASMRGIYVPSYIASTVLYHAKPTRLIHDERANSIFMTIFENYSWLNFVKEGIKLLLCHPEEA